MFSVTRILDVFCDRREMVMKLIRIVFCLGMVWSSFGSASPGLVQGFSLTEIGQHLYDASADPNVKTDAQNVVDQVYELGARHISLSPRAYMRDPRGTEVIPMTPLSDRSQERERYRRLISYIKGKGMTVGIRPIFFVVDSSGNTPFVETLPDGTKKNWWHGNIQPRDPNAWFESFKTYLDIYMTIAKLTKIDEFTIGAELYSMTVGIEDQWKEYPYGFPGRWLELLNYTRTIKPWGLLRLNLVERLHAGAIESSILRILQIQLNLRFGRICVCSGTVLMPSELTCIEALDLRVLVTRL